MSLLNNFDLKIWFVFALISTFSLTIAEILQQKILVKQEEKFSVIESNFFTMAIQLLIFIPILLLSNLDINIFKYVKLDILWMFLPVGFFSWIAGLFYLKSFEVENISFSVLFSTLTGIVASLAGYLFLNESIYLIKIVGMMLILLAIFLVSFKSVLIEKNHFYGLIAGFLYGVLYATNSFIIHSMHPLIFFFYSYLITIVFGFIFHFKVILRKAVDFKIISFKNIFISGISYSVFNILSYYSYSFGGESGRVDFISDFEIFLIIIFEYFILKQKTDFWLKITSFIIALIGVIFLGFL